VTRLTLLPLALTAALLTGCTAGGGEESATSADPGSAAAPAELSAPGAADTPAAALPDAGTPALARADLAGSAVVRTAELGVRVDDVRAAADDAARLVREAGGDVAAERADASAARDVAGAELTLRVPPERFDELVGRLAALGDERSRAVSTEEVGDQLVDLESRLTTQRASVARVQALLAQAVNLGEVVQVEAELTRRTADLESLQARLAALQEQVQLSTVVLRLDTADDALVAAGPTGFSDGLRGGWTALLASLTVLATVTGALLPFAPLAVIGLLVLRVRRSRTASGPSAA
jgi:hypothetical protein